jgi:hypothetical protein
MAYSEVPLSRDFFVGMSPNVFAYYFFYFFWTRSGPGKL